MFVDVVSCCFTAAGRKAYPTLSSSEKHKIEADLSEPDFPVSVTSLFFPCCDDSQIVTCLLQAMPKPALDHVIKD